MKYIAITLGPITRTIEMAESTKELWAASYFFSYLAKKIVEPFVKKNRTFQLPLINEEMQKPHCGAGLFPDRYIFKSEPGDLELLKQHSDQVLIEIAGHIASPSLPGTAKDVSQIYHYLKSYIKIYFIEHTLESDDPHVVIPACEKYLNIIENQETFPEQEETMISHQKSDFLKFLITNVNGKIYRKDKNSIPRFTGSFLTRDAFGDMNGERLFESILEISASELNINIQQKALEVITANEKNKGEKYSDQIWDAEEIILNDNKAQLRPYHKYIAIIKSDGDSMGETIKSMGAYNIPITQLSKALLSFNIESINEIVAYGGKPIFIGGDDLLCFAPVCCNGNNVFNLVEKLSTCFDQCINQHLQQYINACSEAQRPLQSLSFGISITYHKYPMFEALHTTDYLLEMVAKDNLFKYTLSNKNILNENMKRFILKNKLAFSLQKHSGQIYHTAMSKKGKSYVKFNMLLQKYILKNKDMSKTQESEKFLSSVIQMIRAHAEILQIILQNEDKRTEMLKNYFDNNFNESCHLGYTGLFEDIQTLLCLRYQENIQDYQNRNEIIQQNTILTSDEKEILIVSPAMDAIHTIFTALQFIHFINYNKDE